MADINLILRKNVEGLFKKAHIALTAEEREHLEFVDFGFGAGNVDKEGLQLIVYCNNERYCAKEMVLLPYQTCPEHRHPPKKNDAEGKMETFRCRYGKVYLYVAGDATKHLSAEIPVKHKKWYTVRHEIVLHAGQQYTIPPNTRHWFQAGNKGAVISEFSSPSDDASDIFTNPNIQR